MDTESHPQSSDTDEQSEDSNSSAEKAQRKRRGKRKRKMGPDEEWLKHIKKKKLFICNECGKQLSSGPSFEEHQKRHLGVRATVTCYECGKQLNHRSLKRHQELHLLQQINSPKSISVQAIKCRKNGKKILKML